MSKRRFLQSTLPAGLLVCSVASGWTQNLLANGSFETPHVTNATKVSFADPAGLLPWQTTATNFELWTNGWKNSNAGMGPLFSADGGQNLEILSSTNDASVWQTVPTLPGEHYTLSFYYSPRPGAAADGFSVDVNSTNILAVVDDGSELVDFDWQQFATTFVADTNLTTVSFSDFSFNGGGSGTHIDGVVLEHVPAVTIQKAAGSGVHIQWVGVSNEFYRVQFRTNLIAGNWSNLGGTIFGSNAINSISITPDSNTPRAFYRVRTGP